MEDGSGAAPSVSSPSDRATLVKFEDTSGKHDDADAKFSEADGGVTATWEWTVSNADEAIIDVSIR